MDLRKTKNSTQLKTRDKWATKSYSIKSKSHCENFKDSSQSFAQTKTNNEVEFKPKDNFGKETLMKLLKVADEILHSNPTIKQPVVCPTIYHEDSIVLMPLCIRCLLYVRDSTFISLLNFSTSLKGR